MVFPWFNTSECQAGSGGPILICHYWFSNGSDWWGYPIVVCVFAGFLTPSPPFSASIVTNTCISSSFEQPEEAVGAFRSQGWCCFVCSLDRFLFLGFLPGSSPLVMTWGSGSNLKRASYASPWISSCIRPSGSFVTFIFVAIIVMPSSSKLTRLDLILLLFSSGLLGFVLWRFVKCFFFFLYPWVSILSLSMSLQPQHTNSVC